MVNYWFLDSTQQKGRAASALLHAILSIRDLPDEQKQSWKLMFDKYVFGYDKAEFDYIPKHAQGALGELDDDTVRRLRALLLSQLNK